MEACILYPRYHKVQIRKMVSELMGDCRNDFITEDIRQDTLESVMANLHLANNAKAPQDKLFKVTLPNPT